MGTNQLILTSDSSLTGLPLTAAEVVNVTAQQGAGEHHMENTIRE